MPRSDAPAPLRHPTKDIPPETVAQNAHALTVNVSQTREQGLVADVAKTTAQLWLEENAAALDALNAYIEENGLPLDRHRQL